MSMACLWRFLMCVGLVCLDSLCLWGASETTPGIYRPRAHKHIRILLCLWLVCGDSLCVWACLTRFPLSLGGPPKQKGTSALGQTTTGIYRPRAHKHIRSSIVSMACSWRFLMCVGLVCLDSFCLWGDFRNKKAT